MKEKTKWMKNCPKCGCEQSYSTKGNLTLAINSNKVCMGCRNKHLSEITMAMGRWVGKNNPMYGISRYGKDNPNYGKTQSDEQIKAHSEFMADRYVGELNAFYGKTHTDETKQKLRTKALNRTPTPSHCKAIRLGVIKYREVNGLVGFVPNYNPSSIPIIEAKANELGITDLQHAENGGEFYIKELGYWVDGYSKEKNIVIEYDEKHHKRYVDKDMIRQAEIEEHLNCEFIRIVE